VIAVGTTTLRCWNRRAACDGELKVGSGETDCSSRPAIEFRVVDLLITNFHLPKSTLLMLVSAFAGQRRGPRGLPPRDRAALPIFQLWRCHAAARRRICEDT
jgi:hypothetical protein